MGVAAHITAASPGGPRYDSTLTPAQRKSGKNGIWLCQYCAKLIDNDAALFPKELILRWKGEAENWVLQEINATQPSESKSKDEDIIKVSVRGTIRATAVPPFGTGEPLHLELTLTIINHGSMPIFVVSAALKDESGRNSIDFSGACNEDIPIQPGGRRKATNKLLYHDFPPHTPAIPKTAVNLDILKTRTRMEFRILRFVCQKESRLCIESARGNIYNFNSVDVCDEHFLAWPFLAAPPYIEEEFRNKSLAELEPKWLNVKEERSNADSAISTTKKNHAFLLYKNDNIEGIKWTWSWKAQCDTPHIGDIENIESWCSRCGKRIDPRDRTTYTREAYGGRELFGIGRKFGEHHYSKPQANCDFWCDDNCTKLNFPYSVNDFHNRIRRHIEKIAGNMVAS